MRALFCIQLHASTANGDDWSLFLFTGYNMEAASFMRNTRNHADSLLANLNLQREKVQLCDCVVRQKQNPGQLYPAHRCVLAASSPVLAAILPSSGALVELQAPCLSDSVLELLLDYIYTGALPNAREQQQYSLLAAACHLQMDGLQEALMHQEQRDVIGAPSYTLSSTEDSGSCIQKAEQPPQNLSPNIPWTPKVSKGGEGATCTAAGEDETIGEQMSHNIFADEEQTKKTQTHHSSFLVSSSSACTSSLDNGSPSSLSSLHFGAVSVICHGSQAAVLQTADTDSPHHPVYRASASCSTIKDSQSPDGGSVYNDKHNRNSKDPFSSQRWAGESGSKTRTEESSNSGDVSVITEKEPNTGSNSQAKVVCPKGQVKEEHSYSCRRALADVAFGQYENISTESSRHTTGTAEELGAATPESGLRHTSGHRVNRCGTTLDFQQVLNIEITDAAWPKTADGHMFDPTSGAEGTSYCGRIDYRCLSPKDTCLTHRPVGLSPESLDSTSSDEEPPGIVTHSCDEQNFKTWTTNKPLLQDASPESTELVAGYQRETQTLDESTVWFQELDVQASVGRDQSRARDVIWDTEDAPSSREDRTSSACSPPTPSNYVQGSVPSAWSVCVPTHPSPRDPRNGSSHHPFQCSLCLRSFSQRGSLNRHTRSHLGVRPFPCPRCPMTFSRQYRVTEHMRVHQRSALGNYFPKSTTSSVLDSTEAPVVNRR